MPKTPSSRNKCLKKAKAVPYARGFHPSTLSESQSAIGIPISKLPREYQDHEDPKLQHFRLIPQPTSVDDWLAQYVEEGQTYSQYVSENPWFSRRKGKFLRQAFVSSGKTLTEKYPEGKIYLAKMGNFKPSGLVFDEILSYAQKFLCLPVEILEGLDIQEKNGDLHFIVDPSHNPSKREGARIRRSLLKSRQNSKAKHLQIQVDSILPKMRSVIPDDALCLIGLTSYDLYGDDSDLFVAGMAAGFHRVAVFSLFRYNPALTFSPEFWYDTQKSKNISDQEEFHRLMLQRSCKLVVHEICHLLGIAHCTFYSCCMNGSGHLSEDFSQPMNLCPIDLRKLQALVGFDVTERYQDLLDFFTKHKMYEEADWVKQRLEFIELK